MDANLSSQLIDEEEGPSSPTVYYVDGLQHIARACLVDPKVPGAGLCADVPLLEAPIADSNMGAHNVRKTA